MLTQRPDFRGAPFLSALPARAMLDVPGEKGAIGAPRTGLRSA